ncbi:MAG: NADH-quinone oxidoreductase subunit M [Chloroflexota bacterium]|nr:NADH-quinone oxidoreductase subunit M [Chloroflexota bacterium]
MVHLIGLTAATPGSLTSNSLSLPILSIILFLPLAGALLISFLNDERQIKVASVVVVALDFVLAMFVLADFKFDTHTWVFQFHDKYNWVSALGITYWLGVDGISVFLVGLTTLIVGIGVIAANYMIAERLKVFLMLMLSLQTAVLGVFMSLNLFLFFVFWEAMLIPTYFLIGVWGEERRVYATLKFLLYTIFGSFLMLVGIFYLWSQRGTLDMAGPNGLIAHPVSSSAQIWLFLAFGMAFAIKIPIWPFHTWAPTAYTESPIPVVVVVAGVLSKAGAFGFLRYCLPLFPSASRQLAALLSVLCVIGMLYAAVLALVQTDIKRLVAYASISHMNLLALGIFAYNNTSIDGTVLQMINHSVIITGLFLAVGFIAARTGTRMLPDLGGLGIKRPVLMWVFFVFILAGLDLPGLNSFSGEFLILVGVFKSNAWYASVAALTVILAAWYMIRFFQNTMNGPITVASQQVAEGAESIEEPERTVYQYPVLRRLIPGDLRLNELGLLIPLMILIFYIGLQPDSLTARMNPTTGPLSTLVQTAGPGNGTPSVGGGR